MSDALATFGIAFLLSWLALPLLAFVASRARRPEERQATLTLALFLGVALFAAPWARTISQHVTALCFSKETLSAVLPVAPGPIFPRDHGLIALLPAVGAIGLASIALGLGRWAVASVRLMR